MRKFIKGVCAVMAAAVIIGSGVGTQDVQAAGKKVVVLDPGHGGGDCGAAAKHGGQWYYEADMNWKISNYTKDALERYSNIEVHLTRSENENPGLGTRVSKASLWDADLLVSQHINSVDNPSPRGASVMISRGTWRPYLHDAEYEFGKLVMQELGRLGIYQRFPETGGMEYRMSENGSKYPNGGVRDYYGIVAQSVEANLPGVIIEHAFISNAGDVANFLSSDAKLKALGEADARAIVRYLNLEPKETGWNEKDGKWYYIKQDGSYATGWFKLDGFWYYCDDNGVRQTGWVTHNGKKRYLNPKNGAMYAKKLITVDGKTYYMDGNGYPVVDWRQIQGKWYRFDNNGVAKSYFTKDGGKLYYLDPKTHQMVTHKLITFKGDQYYVDKKGVMQTGWVKLNGKQYYFHKDGKGEVGWETIGGQKYFFDKKGVMQTGWVKYKGNYFYLRKTSGSVQGSMVRGRTMKVDGVSYKFDKNGVCLNKK